MPVRRTAWLAALVLLPVLPGQAATPSARVVTVGYSMPAGITTGSNATLFGNPTATGIARADEDKVSVSATDSGGAVALVVDVTPRGGSTTRHITCQPLVLPMRTGTTVQATPVAGRCSDGHVSMPRGGHVTLSFHRRPPKPKATGAPPTMRWAVVIGIGDYAGNTHSTVGGTGDAAIVRKALLASGWRSDHIKVLTNSAATATGIRNAFAWLASHSGPRTFSLLHYSGHVCIVSRGPCASGHTYLWSYDNHFIPETEVRSRMAQVRGYSWLDLAGCEGGAFDLHSSSRLFTASSRANETSYENPDWKQSVWTGLAWDRGFMRGLADDRGVARRATIGEMTAYGKRQAPPMTANGSRGPQHPVVVGGNARWTLYAPPGG